MPPRKSLLITDLDNTLYDWFTFWYRSFSAMLGEIERISGRDRATLIPHIKRVHEARGTAEYAFLIQELEPLRELHPGEDLATVYSSAIDAYNEARDQNLRLYPGVMETLNHIKSQGCAIVAYTESLSYYSSRRIAHLGLDGIVEALYSPPDSEFPGLLDEKKIRTFEEYSGDLRFTRHDRIPRGEHKPNPRILKKIIADAGATIDETLYVGDSLTKDVSMAQAAGVADAFAEYGTSHRREEYELLRQVTHWTAEAVEAEKIHDKESIVPTIVLQESFDELLNHFVFATSGAVA